jgi:hypothetical protein
VENLFLSVCSYWRAVNVEMMNATLEFLDEVERRKRVNSGVPPGGDQPELAIFGQINGPGFKLLEPSTGPGGCNARASRNGHLDNSTLLDDLLRLHSGFLLEARPRAVTFKKEINRRACCLILQ